MASRLAFLLLAVNINSLVNSSNEQGILKCNADDEDYSEDALLTCTDLKGTVQITTTMKYFHFECKQSAKINLTIIPKLDRNNVNNVHFVNCVEENMNIGSILEQFGIHSTQTFTLEKMTGSLRPSMFSNVFEKLEHLNLRRNVIRTLDENVFQALGRLKDLELSDNEMIDLPRNIFAHLRNLYNLLLSNNELKFLKEGLLTHQNQLRYLTLSGNKLTELPSNLFANLINLNSLSLWNNKIKFLEEGIFAHQKKLTDIVLKYNEITDLPRNIFANLTSLESLSLSNNAIKLLDEGVFTHQKKLMSLYLENNKITDLPTIIFANLTNLLMLSLSNNLIKLLDEGLFISQQKLIDLELSDNEISHLPKNIFASLTNLRTLTLSNNKLKCLEKGLFTHQELEYLALRSNDIKDLPRNIFANLTNLTKALWLSNNKLTYLDDGLFNGLNSLKHLHLSYNNLTAISGLIFRELHNVITISLDHNHIKSINSYAFVGTVKLISLHLNYNQLQYFDNTMYLDELRIFDLSNNYLITFPSGWEGMSSLRVLDLSYNNIPSLKYGDVQIKNIKFYCMKLSQDHHKEIVERFHHSLRIDQNYEIMPKFHEKLLHILLNNNRLNCDCSMYRFLSVFPKRRINELMISVICEDTHAQCNKTIDSTLIECPISNVSGCYCKQNCQNNTEIHCSDSLRKLTFLTMNETNAKNSLELYIHNKSLTELPNLQSNERVIFIQASHNDITDVKLENLPPNLRYLDVSNNKIKAISVDVIDALNNHKNLKAFLISHNPWQCDCSTNTEKFIKFFTETISMTDRLQTECRLPSGLNNELSSKVWKEVCAKEEEKTILFMIAVLSIIIGFLCILLAILVYKFKKPIQIWLYAHNICLCCIGEDDFDKDKEFDAFISYTFHDEDIAVSIVNELETGNPRFKICTHMRDFVPGKLIQQSIAESMDNSCRTILILSKNFLQSRWCRSEFRRAYETGLVERRMRLIMVINGDIGDREQLEPTLKSYLKTHTYIEWSDPWFWQKMRYALPHRNVNDGGNANNIEMAQMS